MAAARKSDADKTKKSLMPRLLIGVWLIALTVLLVIMFTNMPEKRNGGQGTELVKKISVPPPEAIKNLATKASVNRLENRVETVETQTAQVDDIRRTVEKHDGEIAVLDQRVDRLETTVSDKLRLPSRSFSEIPEPPAEKTEPTPTVPAESAAAKTTDSPPPAEKPVDKTTTSTPTPQSTDAAPAGTVAEKPAVAAGKKPTPASRKPGLAGARPAAGPSGAEMETPADRRAVQRKIAEREAYIRRTAPLRRSGEWAPAPVDRAMAAPAAEGYAVGETDRPPYVRKRSALPITAPAGSIHYLGKRFGHRVDLSDKLTGGFERPDADPSVAKTAPGMTIFSDRRLDPMKTD